jgi:transcriptional regulator with XRE-family HTH domain
MIASVADLCEQRKITPGELARQTGLDDTRVAAIILGRWTPSPAERQKIATAFMFSPDAIAWGHKTPVQHLYGHGPGGETS